MKEPSNQTIYALLQEIQEQNNKDHQDIKDRQDITNGNVAENTTWRNRIIGGLLVISGVIIPIFIKLYF